MNRRFTQHVASLSFSFLLLGAVANAQAQERAKGAGGPAYGIAGSPGSASMSIPEKDHRWENHKLEAQVIKAAGNTWGYEILVDGQLYIRQATVPGRPGINGFATAADALKVATLTIKKMQAGESPVLISEADLHTLNIL